MADQIKKESKIKKFFKDYKSEFKKIVWPSKEETLRESGVVVVSIVVVGAVVMLLDLGFSNFFNWLATLV